MLLSNDNPSQGNRGGNNSQRHETTPEEEKLKEQNKDSIPAEDKEGDKFSPGEAEEYNPDDFATD